MFNFGDLNNVPMVSGWVVCLVLAIILIRAVKRARKGLIRLVTAGLVLAVVFVFYASTLSKEPATNKPGSRIVKDTVNEVIDEIKSER
jgi:hypothetical protein